MIYPFDINHQHKGWLAGDVMDQTRTLHMQGMT